MTNILTLGNYYYPSSTSPQITTSFVLSWTETTNTSSNQSELNWSVTTSQSPTGSGYKRTLNSGSVTINGTTHNFTTGSVYNGLVIASGKDYVTHETNGTKTIAVSMTANLGGDSKSNNTNVTLTAIPRATTFTLNTYSLNSSSSGVTLTFTMTSGLTYQSRWSSSNGTTMQWLDRTSPFTWSVAGLDSVGLLVSSGVATLTLELRTLSGSTVIGTTQATVIYTATDSSATIPMSWAQSGNYFGVGFGREAFVSAGTNYIVFKDRSILRVGVAGAEGGIITLGAYGSGNSGGLSGYVLAITITATAQYCDAPFSFKVIHRDSIYDLVLRFSSNASNQMSLTWGYYINNLGVTPTIYVVCSGAVANVYIKKTQVWDNMTVYPPFSTWENGYGRCNILYPFTFLETIPSGTKIESGNK